MILWNRDPSYRASSEACLFFCELLNSRRDHYTGTQIASVLSLLAPLLPSLSLLTCTQSLPAMEQLLKAAVLTSSRDAFHSLQLLFLQNGSFLAHLTRALQAPAAPAAAFSREFVMLTVTDSVEGARTLARIFPLSLVKRLEIQGKPLALEGMNRQRPIEDTAQDIEVAENMALTALAGCRVNWKGFWSSLEQEQSDYAFIWSQEMRRNVSEALASELKELENRRLTEPGAVWDFEGFRMLYPQIEAFVCVDGYYLQQLLDALENGKTVSIVNVAEFVRHVCDLYIVTRNLHTRRALLYLILRVVQIDEQKGREFPVLRYLCFILEDRAIDTVLEGLILQILNLVCQFPLLTEQFQDYNGVSTIATILSQLVTQLVQHAQHAQHAGRAQSVRPLSESRSSMDPMNPAVSIASSKSGTHPAKPDRISLPLVPPRQSGFDAISDDDSDSVMEMNPRAKSEPQPESLSASETGSESEGESEASVGASLKCSCPHLSAGDRCQLALSIVRHTCESLKRIRSAYLTEAILSRLLRFPLLLSTQANLVEMASILMIALETSTPAQTLIYRSGIFRVFLLLSCEKEGMPIPVAQLFHRYHVMQEPTDLQNAFQDANEELTDLRNRLQNAKNTEERVELARKYSFLRFFLPDSLIALLEREGPSAFCNVFNADRVETSEVIWNRAMREHMRSCIADQVREYCAEITADSSAVWRYVPPQPINYENIDNKLCIRHVFLETFLKPECSVPPTVDPVLFFRDLIDNLNTRWSTLTRMKGDIDEMVLCDIRMILQSLLKVLQTKKEVSQVGKNEFATMEQCLNCDLNFESSQQIVGDVLAVLAEALCPASFGKPSMINVRNCADSDVFESFNYLIEQFLPNDLPELRQRDLPKSQILYKTLSCVKLIASEAGAHLCDVLVRYPTLIHTLSSFVEPNYLERNGEVCKIAMETLEVFLHHARLLDICVSSGCLIFFLQVSICLEEHSELDKQLIQLTERCLQLLIGVGSDVTVPSKVLEALTLLVTPGLVKALRAGEFIRMVRSDNVRAPLLIWNRSMQEALLDVLDREESNIATSSDALVSWNVSAFCADQANRSIYKNLASEYVIDEVFLDPFLQQPDAPLADPTPEHFLKELVAKTLQLQDLRQGGLTDSSNEESVNGFLYATVCSLMKLLEVYGDLVSVFINDPRVCSVFRLLIDSTLPWNIVQVLLVLLRSVLGTPTACERLIELVPDMQSLLQDDNTACEMLVLDILELFIQNNDQVVQRIMKSGLILTLLDMSLFYEKEYDPYVQDRSLQVLGKMMKSFKFGEMVREYMITLFSPLFRTEEEEQAVLLNCGEDPSSFIHRMNTPLETAKVYWNEAVRRDLFTFLKSEAHQVHLNEQVYVYEPSEVAKRMQSYRVTLNAQLVVADVFIEQYKNSPFCSLDPSAFLTGLIENAKQRLPGVRKGVQKDREEYCSLLHALRNFMQDQFEVNEGTRTTLVVNDPSLTTLVVSFLVDVIFSNVPVGQDFALTTLQFISTKPYGRDEFMRNNKQTKERSYIALLLAASSIVEKQNDSSFLVVSILKNVILENDVLRDTCYRAGVLFYAFHSILSNLDDIDSPQSTASVFLSILKRMATVPDIEKDILAFTTSRFYAKFLKEPNIVKLFIRQPHEAPQPVPATEPLAEGAEPKVYYRMWRPEAYEAICEVAEQEIARLNSTAASTEGWDRFSNRFQMDSINEEWKKFTREGKPVTRPQAESTGIKRRQGSSPYQPMRPQSNPSSPSASTSVSPSVSPSDV